MPDHEVAEAVILDQRIARARDLDRGAGAGPDQGTGKLGLAAPSAPERDHVAGADQAGKTGAEFRVAS